MPVDHSAPPREYWHYPPKLGTLGRERDMTATPHLAYCAPWCGSGCSKAAHDRAVREADELARRMGDGWTPHVHENGGWYYRVIKGCASIRPQISGSTLNGDWTVTGYSAWIEPGDNVGHTMVQFITEATAPEDALGIATQMARTHVSHLNAALADILG